MRQSISQRNIATWFKSNNNIASIHETAYPNTQEMFKLLNSQ
jgi:hypothetical protein